MAVESQKFDKSRYQIIPRVLIFAARGDSVLLIKGAPDKKVWPGQYNGIGGHVEQDESVLSAAYREFLEETGLTLEDPALCAVVTIDTQDNPGIGMYVFKAQAGPGDPSPTQEGTLEWVDTRTLDLLPLVEDLPVLIPIVLHWQPGNPVVFCQYSYSEDNELIMRFD
ncbi:MAG: NUDIX hydrolase [Anaerolineales bacterium]